MTLVRALAIAAFCTLVGACGSWVPVPYTPQPSSIAEPAKEVETLLNLRSLPAVKIEVSEGYIKEVFVAGNRVIPRTLNLRTASDIKVVRRGDVHQVSVYDATGEEIWDYQPDSKDLATCQRMVDALYALSGVDA